MSQEMQDADRLESSSTDPREREIQRQFLDEAQAYWVTLEASVLGLAGQRLDLQKINAAMRAAHSIKGGAAMMGYPILSDFAHRLEDSFKVLKTKQQSLTIDAAMEQHLLQGVDYLQRVIEANRQSRAVDQQWLSEDALPLFELLREELGDPEEETAASVLGGEDGGQALLGIIFSSEVEEVLLRLESLVPNTDDAPLRSELMTIAGELGGLGEMLQLSAFTSLCESVLEALDQGEQPTQAIAQAAQASWRQAQALVLTQQLDLIPTQLGSLPDLDAAAALPESGTVLPASPVTQLPESQLLEHQLLESQRPEQEEQIAEVSAFLEQAESWPEQQPWPEQQSWPEQPFLAESPPWPELEAEQSSPPVPAEVWSSPSKPEADEERTVRVSLKRVEQLNDLFGELTIERNALALYCDRLRSLTQLLKERVGSLEQNNQELQTSYRELTQSPTSQLGQSRLASVGVNASSRETNRFNGHLSTATAQPAMSAPDPLASRFADSLTESHQGFDRLEMDEYDSLSLQSQSVVETIVQVKEVTTDIDLSLVETDQTLRNLHKTTKHLRNQLTHLRMRPLTDVLDRFPRALRSLGLEYGKKVSLELQGSNTLVDRNVLEALQEPLMHLLRNAFDHGLEPPEERRAQGKAEEGKITIRAFQRGNRTLIEFQDDGRGINLDKVRAKAAAMGLDGELLATASEQELLSLIFEPGFSTRSQVTTLSGRGVGMDVVRNRLQPVRGEITVATQPGQGTTFTLAVPFSLAVLRVQIVESNGMLLAVPADSVAEVILAEHLPEEIQQQEDAENSFTWNGETVRRLSLAPWLQFNCPRSPYSLEANPKIDCPALLRISDETSTVAIDIERSWGEQEVAIRQVEGQIAMPPGFSNCSIMGDGRVIPLVNLVEILQGPPQVQSPYGVTTAGPAAENPAVPLSISAKPGVLIVDDSINVRRFLALTLEKAGYRVEQAKDGLQALEMLSAPLAVQAIICDIEMPRLDGYGVLAKVKANPAMAHLPVAMLTSRSGDKHRKLAIDLGASAYFSKPYNETELLEQLESMIVPV